jgi:hypothetical protein
MCVEEVVAVARHAGGEVWLAAVFAKGKAGLGGGAFDVAGGVFLNGREEGRMCDGCISKGLTISMGRLRVREV